MNLNNFGFSSDGSSTSGAITGAGTVPKLPKFTGATTIGDSQVSDNGVTVFIGTSATSTKAIFEVNSTTLGSLLSRMTTVQRDAIVVGATENSLLVFNNTVSRYQYYNHTTTSWVTIPISTDIPAAPTTLYSGDGSLASPRTVTMGSNSLTFTGNDLISLGKGAVATNTALGLEVFDATITGGNTVGIGYQSLKANTTGSSNTATGSETLSSNTTGTFNSAFGRLSLKSNTIGTLNTGLGVQALYSNTTGGYNTASGVNALFANISGSYNVALGYEALQANTTSDSNTAIGSYALRNNTTGTSNVALGYESLFNSTTASYNIALGYQALYTNDSGVSNMAIGHQSLFSNTTGGQNVAIGYQAASSNTSGSGNTVVGYQAMGFNSTASNNTAVGREALYTNSTGGSNVALGLQAGYYETGSNKLFIDNTARTNEADGRAKSLIYGIFDAATTNQYLNINANTNTPLAHYNYMAASNSADTIGDVRTYATYVGTTSSFIVEKCTVANAAKGGGTWVIINNNYLFAASDETSPLIADAVNAAYTDYLPYAMTVQSVMINVNTAPTDANIIVDIHKNGVTIFTTLISIDATENTSLTATTPYVLDGTITFAQGDKLEAFITQVGSTVAGTGLKVKLL